MSIVNSSTTVNGSSGTLTLQTNGTNAASINSSQVLSTVNDATINGLTIGLGGGAPAGNTVVGNGAQAATSTGSNVAVGAGALAVNTASYNTAVGFQAAISNTSGTYLTAFGQGSLGSNTTANGNAAFGENSLANTTTGGDNTGIGTQALFTNSTGAFNTAVGYGAGSLMTVGSYNTLVGCYNGNQNGLDIRASSNYIVLSDGAGNPRMYFDGSGNQFIPGSTSIGFNGYVKLQNGLIIQWGTGTATTAGNAINFPIAFPNNCLNITSGIANTITTSLFLVNVTNTGFTFGCAGVSDQNHYWYAVGY